MNKLTYQFHKVPSAQIIVDRDSRQRKKIDETDALAQSIKMNGLINPIVVTRDLKLVAGERRLAAWNKLVLEENFQSEIPVHYVDELSEFDLQIIELEENIKRKDMTWQEIVLAAYTFHKRCMEHYTEWSLKKSAEALSCSEEQMYRYINAGKELEAGNENIKKAETLTQAANIISRSKKRETDAKMSELTELLLNDNVEVNAAGEIEVKRNNTMEVEEDFTITNADFITWLDSYRGPKFNVLHCDFPYGIGIDKSFQAQTWSWEKYDDKPEVYWNLLAKLLSNLDKITEQTAHIIFWFPMKYYIGTVTEFEKAGLKVEPYPLIWYKTNRAMRPDYRRLPARAYETALVIAKGDAYICECLSNVYASGVPEKTHPSEKPQDVLMYFLRMFVDKNTRLLDPTCGSGNAIVCAEKLGAERALGLELSAEFTNAAQTNLRTSKYKD